MKRRRSQWSVQANRRARRRKTQREGYRRWDAIRRERSYSIERTVEKRARKIGERSAERENQSEVDMGRAKAR